MAFPRLLSSFKAAVPAFIRRRPIVAATVSYFGISYAARPLIHHFNTNEENANADDPRRPFRATDVLYPGRMWSRFMFSLLDRLMNVRETEESVVLNVYTFNNVRKEEVEVTVDRNTLTVKDALPGRNQFNGTINLTGKHCDILHTTANLNNNFLQVAVPKLKNQDEDEEDDLIVHHVDVE